MYMANACTINSTFPQVNGCDCISLAATTGIDYKLRVLCERFLLENNAKIY